jgi:hypothetical protein
MDYAVDTTDQQVKIEFRRQVANTNIPSATVVENSELTVDLSGVSTTPCWVKATYPEASRPYIAAETPVWLIISDPDGSANGYMSMWSSHRWADAGGTSAYTTTNGFTTNPGATGYPANVAVKQNGEMYGGSLYGAGVNVSPSNARMRGLLWTPDGDIEVCGTSLGVFRHIVYGADQLPNDTPLWDFGAPAGTYTGGISIRLFEHRYICRAGHSYLLVMAPTGSQSTGYYPFIAAPDSDLTVFANSHGPIAWVEQSGVGVNSWTTPDSAKAPSWSYFGRTTSSGGQIAYVF